MQEPIRKAETVALTASLADRLSRIAWLVAHSYGLILDDVLQKPRFRPEATLARQVAMAISAALLDVSLEILGEFFGESVSGVMQASTSVGERAMREHEFATTLNFLKSSCAAAALSG